VERDHRALLDRQLAAGPVKRRVNQVEGLGLRDLGHFSKEEPADQAAPNPQAAADTDLPQPGGPAVLVPH
jgi:hypothetical protein